MKVWVEGLLCPVNVLAIRVGVIFPFTRFLGLCGALARGGVTAVVPEDPPLNDEGK